jgi:hypothetical protein
MLSILLVALVRRIRTQRIFLSDYIDVRWRRQSLSVVIPRTNQHSDIICYVAGGGLLVSVFNRRYPRLDRCCAWRLAAIVGGMVSFTPAQSAELVLFYLTGELTHATKPQTGRSCATIRMQLNGFNSSRLLRDSYRNGRYTRT